MTSARHKTSLVLKISLAIVLVQIAMMAFLGAFYVGRFTSEIDRRVLAQIKAPAMLMNEGTLAFESITRREVVQQVVGNEIVDALIIGPDNTVYYSVKADDIGRSVLRIERLNPDLFNDTFGDSQFGRDVDGNYISIEPVYSAAGKAPFLSVYIKASAADVQREKNILTLLFVSGSLLISLLVSIALILSLQFLVLRGLRRLTAAARVIGSGQLDEADLASLPRDSGDELGELSHAFQDMSHEVSDARAKLVGYSRRLESDVASRTAELDQRIDELKRLNRLMVDRELKMIELKKAAGDETVVIPQALGPGVVTSSDEVGRGQVAMLNLLEDISHEKARVETVIANISDGLCVISFDGVIMMLNPSLRTLFALGDGDFVGRSYRQILPEFFKPSGERLAPEDNPVTAAIRERSAASGIYAIKLGERLMQVSCRVTPVEADQNLLGLVAVFRDISDEYELDRAKSDFIDVAVHQLKTPLTALRWSVENLSEKEAEETRSDEEKQTIKDITTVTQRLNTLVKSLLNISRIESGRLTVDPKPTDLRTLVRDALAELAAAVKEKGHRVTVDAPADLPLISVDASLIGEAYKNLLTNAIKYTPAGGQIEVHLERVGNELVSAVKDDGIGIPADELKRMANKFFRASNAVNSHEEGTGLGLYFVKQIVGVSGGRFWFDSKEGDGSTFCFSLPLAGSEARSGEVKLN